MKYLARLITISTLGLIVGTATAQIHKPQPGPQAPPFPMPTCPPDDQPCINNSPLCRIYGVCLVGSDRGR